MHRRVRRKNRIFLGVVVLLMFMVAAVILYEAVFVVRRVVVSGEMSASSDQITRLAKVEFGKSIWNIDHDEIKENLESTGKYALDGVKVDLPGTLILDVRERSRNGMILNGGKILVLDAEGYVVEVCASIPEDGGVFISGLGATSYRLGEKISAPERSLETMEAVLNAISDHHAEEYVSELNLSQLKNIWLTTRTGLRVELGDISGMDRKILWMRTAVADLEQRGDTTGTLDISSGNNADYTP